MQIGIDSFSAAYDDTSLAVNASDRLPSRAADFVAPWIQILAKLTVKGILGGFDSSPTSEQCRSLPVS
jgi:hypothetical protein